MVGWWVGWVRSTRMAASRTERGGKKEMKKGLTTKSAQEREEALNHVMWYVVRRRHIGWLRGGLRVTRAMSQVMGTSV